MRTFSIIPCSLLKRLADSLYFCLLLSEHIPRPTAEKSVPAVVAWNIVHII